MEVWTPPGRRIIGFAGPVLNQHEVGLGYFNFDDNPIPNSVIDAAAVDGRLMILFSRPVEDWKRHFTTQTLPNGSVRLRLRPGSTEYSAFISRIEVIDLRSATIVARQDGPPGMTGFVGPDRLFQNRLGSDETPQLAVWRLVWSKMP